jgi:hypothetical protein
LQYNHNRTSVSYVVAQEDFIVEVT